MPETIDEYRQQVKKIHDDPFFQEGQRDYAEGYDSAECPYDEGTDGEYGWLSGWEYASANHQD